MVRTKTKLRFRAGKTAALAIGIAMLAGGGIAFRSERGAVSGEMGISPGWIHDAVPWGYTPAFCMNIKSKGLQKLHFVTV